MSAAEFKARCLSLMDEVRAKGTRIVITKRGKPVAELVPVEKEAPVDLFGCMKGTAIAHGDLIEPLDVHWDATD